MLKDFDCDHFEVEVPEVEAAAGAGLELESLEDFVSALVSGLDSGFDSLFVSLDELSELDPLPFDA
jgi:hypothetical protein